MTRRVLITGSRAWDDRPTIRAALAEVWHPDTILVSGHCGQGADLLTEQCWKAWGGRVEPWPAEWDKCGWDCPPRDHRRKRRNGSTFCPLAGRRRNQAMVDRGADICIAFIRDESEGATHCSDAAKAAGIHTIIYRSG